MDASRGDMSPLERDCKSSDFGQIA
jgi:hypothetical protein